MELKQPLLLPAPAPKPRVVDQTPVDDNTESVVDSVTYAYVCHGCRRIVHRFVAEWRMRILPGELISIEPNSSSYEVRWRRDAGCPHPYDYLLDPDRNPEDRSVAFTTVLCEGCYAPAQARYAQNKIKLDRWQASYDKVLAGCERWEKVVVAAFEAHLHKRLQEFEASRLPEIVGDETYAMLADKTLPYRQRRQQFEQVLGHRNTAIEAYLAADFPVETFWDSSAFDSDLETSRSLARELGLTGRVGITSPVEAPDRLNGSLYSQVFLSHWKDKGFPMEGPLCTLRPAASDMVGAGGDALSWRALQAYREFDIAAMLDEARARIRLVVPGDSVRELRMKCNHLANTRFLMTQCERRWLKNQRL
ncbi:hypothetical protein [Thiomonas sp.]|jgi:hypothetical protein|uniref:hypothetical protein n=1 Tax=Thiomonas sp. TaxID=2047785 RepID=UPI000BDDD367|nr:hypothetical protein [Thiomonas sp.]OZB55288.1 MAG: hypothetical protein B7X43_01305 [Thiomonas sp. 15-63-373]